MFHVPEKYRVKNGPFGSDKSYGNNGMFLIRTVKLKGDIKALKVIASDGAGWEHVSVSHPSRTPTWADMCIIKDMFWDESDLVVQIHPPKEHYINNHPHCLHLWRKIDGNTLTDVPPWQLVGLKEASGY